MVVIICCFILDVLDLAWSANDSWLASCSVDNCIVVWNADKFPGKDVQDLKNKFYSLHLRFVLLFLITE